MSYFHYNLLAGRKAGQAADLQLALNNPFREAALAANSITPAREPSKNVTQIAKVIFYLYNSRILVVLKEWSGTANESMLSRPCRHMPLTQASQASH